MDLWEATNKNNIGKVRSLLGQGADPNHKLYSSVDWYKLKLPPVHEACYKGYQEIVIALISAGADVEKGDGLLDRIAFHWACQGGKIKTVKYLCQVAKCRTGKWLLNYFVA